MKVLTKSTELITRFGKLCYWNDSKKVYWADNNVWNNAITLIKEGVLKYHSEDGYLTEIYITL